MASELFETGLSKIRHELKGRLAMEGMYGTVVTKEGPAPESAFVIEVSVKGKTVSRTFDPQQIADCYLRVRGPVLDGIITLVKELEA